MSDENHDGIDAQARARLTLQRLADALGVPSECFWAASGPTDALSDLAALTELLQLWVTLRSDVDRAQLLAAVRGLVARRQG